MAEQEASKKRKLEDGGSETTFNEVSSMIVLWDTDQLRKVLAQAGSELSAVVNLIKEENNLDPKMKKLFVRNLPYTTNDASLRAVFESFGTVTEAVVIMDKVKGQSKGFGFVTFETVEATQAALVEATKEIDGRQAFVNLAAKKENGQGGQGQAGAVTTAVAVAGPVGAVSQGEDIALRKLFVRSLSYETSSDDLNKFFEQYGVVSEAIVLMNRETGTSKGYGFVTMGTTAAATAALIETTKQLGGRNVYVKLAATNDGNRTTGGGASTQQVAAFNAAGNTGGYGQMNQQAYGFNNMGMMGMPQMQQQYGQQAAAGYQQQYAQQAHQNSYAQPAAPAQQAAGTAQYGAQQQQQQQWP